MVPRLRHTTPPEIQVQAAKAPLRAALGLALVALLIHQSGGVGSPGLHSPGPVELNLMEDPDVDPDPEDLLGKWSPLGEATVQHWSSASGTLGVAERYVAPTKAEHGQARSEEAPPLLAAVQRGANTVGDLMQWHGDIFGEVRDIVRVHLFEGKEALDWWSFIVIVVALFLIDYCVLQQVCLNGTLAQHCAMLLFWVFVGVAFAFFVYMRHGGDLVWQWCSGYLLEWLLSMDNLFVFHLIFSSYATPDRLVHKALFVGILGAIFFRMLFFVLLHNLLHMHRYLRYVFGGILVYSGVQAAVDDDEENDPSQTKAVIWLKRLLGDRLQESYDLPEGNLFILKNGKWCVTLMVPVIFCLEITDLLFAVDSVSAKVAQIPDQFMNYSSSVLAMFGTRALFFLINDIIHIFSLMKYGLCFILVFIGVELMFSDYVQLPASSVTIMLVSVFMVSATASSATELWKRCRSPRSDGGESCVKR
jgi:tellurite resistance protein TerC